jgi:hypothetical protein
MIPGSEGNAWRQRALVTRIRVWFAPRHGMNGFYQYQLII